MLNTVTDPAYASLRSRIECLYLQGPGGFKLRSIPRQDHHKVMEEEQYQSDSQPPRGTTERYFPVSPQKLFLILQGGHSTNLPAV